MLNKKEAVAFYVELFGGTKVQATKDIERMFEFVEKCAVDKGGLNIVGQAKFEVVEKPARKGRNPQDGSEIDIPAKKVLKFKAGKKLADAVNV